MTKKELTVMDNFKLDLMNTYKTELVNYFSKDEKQMNKFMSSVVYAINKVPILLKDKTGLMHAVLELAQVGLCPGIGQEAYILPYKGKATAMIGYRGFVRLLYDTGISSVYSEIVYKNDKFKNTMGTNPGIEHEIDPNLSKKQRGPSIGAYVIVKYRGETIFKYMNKNDILEFRDKYSQSYKGKGKEFSPWNEENDPELNMWKKTILKQMMKFLPKTPKLEQATFVDNKESPYDEPFEVVSGGEEDREKAKQALKKIRNEK